LRVVCGVSDPVPGTDGAKLYQSILIVGAGTIRFPDLKNATDAMGREYIFRLVLNAFDPTEILGNGNCYGK